MKKSTTQTQTHSQFHLGENGKVALMAFGFLFFIMLLSYLYWYA